MLDARSVDTCPSSWRDSWLSLFCGPSQSSGVMSVGEPKTGIISNPNSGSGAALLVPAGIIAGLALEGLDMLADYIRTPPTKTPSGGDDFITKTPRDPALEISVGQIVIPGLGLRAQLYFSDNSIRGLNIGFVNGYSSNLRKALRNPTVHAICTGGPLLFGLLLYVYEDVESARQGGEYRPDFGAIYGVWASICYAVAGWAVTAPH